RDPSKLPWKDLGVDIALECTGIFTSKDKASAHLTAGAKRVLVSAPADGADATIVYGVNHTTLTKDHLVVSNGSCTTNCLAPIAKVLNDLVGIETGFMTTIHAYTGDQPTLDTMHKDLYRGRAAAMSMIPTSTGAAKAIGLVLPELKGKLDGVAIRVPTPNVSVVDLKIVAKRNTDPKEINEAMKRASEQELKGILGYTTAPNVSIDFNHDPHSSTFHQDQTKVMNEGTATYVHYRIMNRLHQEGRLTDGNFLEFLQSHTNVVFQPEFDDPRFSGFNPYALGFAIMQDIERIVKDPTEEDREWFPDIAGTGDEMAVLRDVWANYRDESFISQFLSPNLIRQFRLFHLHDDPAERAGILVDAIHDERGYRRIRRELSKQYDVGYIDPNIEVVDVDLAGDRRLMLRHTVVKGAQLSETDTKRVLQHLADLWSYDVSLVEVDAATDKVLKEYVLNPRIQPAAA
ncbi:MAG: SpoVR family protein, partial [Bradyrhizobium sp.]|nr:SpoVR family protein [Bradyrhizobium sp.]